MAEVKEKKLKTEAEKQVAHNNSLSAIKPHQFQKGASGNPAGRPKMPDELRKAFQKASVDACRVLCEIVNNKQARDADRIKAAEVIMDRGYGKPLQSVDVDASTVPQVVFVGEVKD